MKIRTDFVTNSSSSSFIALKFESNTLCEIFERFQKEIVNEKGERHPCAGFDIDDGIVEYREDESGYWDDGPEKLHEALNLLISLMYRWGEEPLEISKKESDNKKVDLSEYEKEDTVLRHKMAKEIFVKRNEIMEDMQFAEVVVGDVGWGGDDDSRYYEDSYDSDTLQEIREAIAERNNIAIEDITDEDFADYVGDFMSVREDTFTFTRSEKTGKGRSKVTSKYYLEG
jgi:hypothetical protein